MSKKNLRLGLWGRKLGMTTIFDDKGERRGVTVVEIEPNVIIQRKTTESDGYAALQVGFGHRRPKLVSKPQAGHFGKAGISPEQFPRRLHEIRLTDADVQKFNVGQELPVAFFAAGDLIDVQGVSKGKGTQGVMKRHNFAGFNASHGTHEFFRHGGSIGCRTDPGRVHKGKRMGGHMGSVKVTVQNIRVARVDADKRLVLLDGAVPGAKGDLVYLRDAIKKPAKTL